MTQVEVLHPARARLPSPRPEEGHSMAFELVLLSLASAVWPLLLVVVLAALHTDEPRRILLAFLITGLTTCTVIGVLVVKAFQHGRVIGDSGSSFSAGVYFGS